VNRHNIIIFPDGGWEKKSIGRGDRKSLKKRGEKDRREGSRVSWVGESEPLPQAKGDQKGGRKRQESLGGGGN